MNIKEIMTTDVRVIKPESSLIHAAQIMKELDIGSVPVCDGEQILGMITDRDIIVRAVAEGMSPEQTQVEDIYQKVAIWIYEDKGVSEAADLMERQMVRRLIVLNRNKNLVGILSLGDLARAETQKEAGQALQKITQPLPHGH